MLLAGLLPLDADLTSRWTWAGAWYYPVGDSFALGIPGISGFQVTRNVKDGGHQGADLSIRRGGDPVRAAANGVVVLSGTGEDPHGFGVHVVIAHRAEDGRLCYSVYAHLERKSTRVKVGDAVAAGQWIGRVGSTGRATSPHLHFEIRLPASAGERWEKAEVVDPIAFVAARLPASRSDSSWSRPYRLWAETAGLLAAGAPDDRPALGEWWCALAAAVATDDTTLIHSPETARERLLAAGVRIQAGVDDASRTIEWDDASTDLEEVPDRLWRLPTAPTSRDELDRMRRDYSAVPATAGNVRFRPPTRADLCLLLAGKAEEPDKK